MRKKRKSAGDELREMANDLQWYEPADPTPRHLCPCCDYVRLAERSNYLICPVCFWEDDGQDLESLDQASGTYKNVVKMTFAKGAALPDLSGLFNSSLEGNTRRAIDFHEGDKIDEKALTALIRAAVALNTSAPATARPVRSQKRPKSA